MTEYYLVMEWAGSETLLVPRGDFENNFYIIDDTCRPRSYDDAEHWRALALRCNIGGRAVPYGSTDYKIIGIYHWECPLTGIFRREGNTLGVFFTNE